MFVKENSNRKKVILLLKIKEEETCNRANPCNIKSDLLDLKDHGCKISGKNEIHVTILLMRHPFLFKKQLDRNTGQEGISHAQQKMLYTWLTVQNVGNKERILLCPGNLVYQIINATLNNPSIPQR